jgi:Cu(I)/Ag(I) efflux system membrane fusion protein
MLQAAKQKLLFYGLSNAQIESIKGKKQIRHTLLFIVLTAIYFGNSGYRRQLCDGRAAIIVTALALWLESQVNEQQNH